MFCNPIAVAIINPVATSPLPKLTPTANPSGKLCMVIAKMNSHTPDKLEEGPSGPKAGLKCGMNRSIKCRITAPKRSPTTAIHGPPNSRDGINKLKDVAANITPAANPSITSNSLSEIRLVKRTGKVPAPVANPAIRLATAPIRTTSEPMTFTHLVRSGIYLSNLAAVGSGFILV
jgi:hypothetical protein